MSIQNAIEKIGRELHAQTTGDVPGLFNKRYWQGQILETVMRDNSFKVDMFRFVDVLPTLQSREQVAKHIQSYLLKKDRPLPMLVGTALKAASSGLTSGIAAAAIRKNVSQMRLLKSMASRCWIYWYAHGTTLRFRTG